MYIVAKTKTVFYDSKKEKRLLNDRRCKRVKMLNRLIEKMRGWKWMLKGRQEKN